VQAEDSTLSCRPQPRLLIQTSIPAARFGEEPGLAAAFVAGAAVTLALRAEASSRSTRRGRMLSTYTETGLAYEFRSPWHGVRDPVAETN
jgi:hypothetical protein